MAERSRAKETTLLISEDGNLLSGSWAKCLNWKLSADAEIKKTKFTGQAEAEGDLEHSGWDFSGDFHESGPELRRVYLRQVAANNAGLPVPRITITATTRFRDGVTPPFTQKLGKVTLKLDNFDASAGEFLKNTISGFASKGDELLGSE